MTRDPHKIVGFILQYSDGTEDMLTGEQARDHVECINGALTVADVHGYGIRLRRFETRPSMKPDSAPAVPRGYVNGDAMMRAIEAITSRDRDEAIRQAVYIIRHTMAATPPGQRPTAPAVPPGYVEAEAIIAALNAHAEKVPLSVFAIQSSKQTGILHGIDIAISIVRAMARGKEPK